MNFAPDHQVEAVKVLVADDDEVMREVVCAPLRKWALEILIARNGREAMEILEKENGPVFAILDWVMPSLSGLAVCRLIRAAEMPVYILLLTSRSSKEEIAEALQAGADDYLVKRVSQEELHARIRLGIRILTLQSQLAAARNGEPALSALNSAESR